MLCFNFVYLTVPGPNWPNTDMMEVPPCLHQGVAPAPRVGERGEPNLSVPGLHDNANHNVMAIHVL